MITRSEGKEGLRVQQSAIYIMYRLFWISCDHRTDVRIYLARNNEKSSWRFEIGES